MNEKNCNELELIRHAYNQTNLFIGQSTKKKEKLKKIKYNL